MFILTCPMVLLGIFCTKPVFSGPNQYDCWWLLATGNFYASKTHIFVANTQKFL